MAAFAASRPDWRAVGVLAEREKLLPILWGYLRDHAELIPAPVREAFRRQAAVTEFRMAATETTLHQVVRALAEEGIRVMLLKGAALATTVYGSFAKRPMDDLDILVTPEDAPRAWDCLRERGWALEYEDGEEFYDSFHHLPALVDPSALKLVLEIHRSMMPQPGPFELDEREVWRDARPVQLGSTEAWVPSTNHLLLHLSVHFAWSHMFRGIGRTVRDVATLIAFEPVDWGGFADLALRARAATCAYWTLAITQSLTGMEVPPEVLARLRPRQPRMVTQFLERTYITNGLFRTCPSLRAANLAWAAGILPEASRHGQSRPWHAGERFQTVFGVGRGRPTFGERVTAQLRLAGRWWRFGRSLISQRRVN